ncbi:MAG TPA: DNA polymerase III subunit gamma/tau, partial [Caulobacteraceae bacterium]|nr:DNA polymerase III subunit gamma/tau [Caulobacteraceae bacterium]
ANLSGRLIARLKEWTGQPWLVAAEGGGGAESAWEREKREDRERRAEVLADPFVKSVMDVFPGAQLMDIRQLTAPEAPADAPVEDDEE